MHHESEDRNSPKLFQDKVYRIHFRNFIFETNEALKSFFFYFCREEKLVPVHLLA
jgi:hypothetical protein